MSNRAGKGDSGSGPRDGSRHNQGRGPNSGSVRKRGEHGEAEAPPWRFTESHPPELAPGTLDAAAILKSVNETLLPVVEKELEEAAEKLGTALAGKETEADLAAAFRAELMRRVLPQFAEAVRKGVLESIRTRQMHLAQLAVLHRQALDAKTMEVVLTRLDHEATKAGLQIVDDIGDQSLFNVVEGRPGVMKRGPVTFELVAPAYVDKESGKLVERGWLRAVAETPPPKPRKMTPGQKRRSTHAEAGEKQKKGISERPGDYPRKRKTHRGQAPGIQQDPGNPPGRETGKRDRGVDGNGKGEAGRIAGPGGGIPRSQARRSVDRSRQRPRDRQSEQRITSPRSEENSDRQVPREESRGGTGAPAGSQDMTTGGRARKKTSHRQFLWAAAGKRMNQRETR